MAAGARCALPCRISLVAVCAARFFATQANSGGRNGPSFSSRIRKLLPVYTRCSQDAARSPALLRLSTPPNDHTPLSRTLASVTTHGHAPHTQTRKQRLGARVHLSRPPHAIVTRRLRSSQPLYLLTAVYPPSHGGALPHNPHGALTRHTRAPTAPHGPCTRRAVASAMSSSTAACAHAPSAAAGARAKRSTHRHTSWSAKAKWEMGWEGGPRGEGGRRGASCAHRCRRGGRRRRRRRR